MSVTREAELALLVAEQETDDTHRVSQGHASLDRELTDDADSGTFYDLVGRDFFDNAIGTRESDQFEDTRPTIRDLFYWKYLHNKHRWTYQRIADHVGRSPGSIRHYVAKPYRKEVGPIAFLESKVDVIRGAYEGGAYLREIADDIYREAGYSTMESCYVGLWDVFNAHDIKRRPGRLLHGMRSRDADPEAARQWRNAKNADRRARGISCSGNLLRRCASENLRGRPCRRWAIIGSDRCVVHALPHPTKKWTRENVIAAFRAWEGEHGQGPFAADWTRAADNHPSFTTVYALFDSWVAALDAAAVTRPTRHSARDETGRYLPKPAAASLRVREAAPADMTAPGKPSGAPCGRETL